MKFYKFFIFLFSVFSIQLFSQANSISEIDQTVDQMKNDIESFERVEKPSSEARFRVCYFSNSQLQIISIQEKDKVEKNVQWFYHNALLIYTETNWFDSSGKSLYQEKTYHDKGTLIAWLNSESTFVDSNSPLFKRMEKELKAYSEKIRNEVME